MPTYDVVCTKCGNVQIMMLKYFDRDTEQVCEGCGSKACRAFRFPPNVRTSKTSVSFVGNYGRSIKEKGIMADLKKSAELEAKALDFSPDSKEYKEMKREAKERKETKT